MNWIRRKGTGDDRLGDLMWVCLDTIRWGKVGSLSSRLLCFVIIGTWLIGSRDTYADLGVCLVRRDDRFSTVYGMHSNKGVPSKPLIFGCPCVMALAILKEELEPVQRFAVRR